MTKETGLIERVLSEKVKRKPKDYPKEELELAIMWLVGEVETIQISRVLKFTPGQIQTWVAPRLKAAYYAGMIGRK
jgi:hypothetical protein